MRVVSFATALLFACIGLSASSLARGPIQPLHVGNWSGGSYTNDQTGAFSHCAASTPYKSGILLLVSVSSKFRWSLGLARPGAHLTPGLSVPVDVTFDGRSQYHVVAVILNTELAEIPMPEGSALIRTFRQAHQMTITGSGLAVPFDLTETGALLPALTGCVRRNLGLPEIAAPAPPRQPPAKKPVTPVAMPAAPSPSTPPAPAPEKPASPSAKAENESSGTGFFVSAQGHVLTNAHVVEGCSSIEVPGPNGLTPVRVVAKDQTNDLALLKTDLAPPKVAQLRAGIRLGEPVAAFGYPLLGVLSSTGNFTLGNVTSLTGLKDDTRYLQISTPVQPGNSGGPLLDASGNFVGVVSAKLNALLIMVATEGDIPQNVNFAIKSSVAATFLESNSVGFSTGTLGAALSPPDLADQGKAISMPVLCK
jgi:S1-C subfamily serine protease